ncbi:MAG: hypothetical protein ACAH59_01770 [Pseudobdellovibrionaceae bacterium]
MATQNQNQQNQAPKSNSDQFGTTDSKNADISNQKGQVGQQSDQSQRGQQDVPSSGSMNR